MSEEEDEVIKLKENVVTRTNEHRLTRYVLRLDLLIFRRVQFWKSFLFGAGYGKQVVLSWSLIRACERNNTRRRSAIAKD